MIEMLLPLCKTICIFTPIPFSSTFQDPSVWRLCASLSPSQIAAASSPWEAPTYLLDMGHDAGLGLDVQLLDLFDELFLPLTLGVGVR